MNDNVLDNLIYIKSDDAAETLKALGLEGETYISREAFPAKGRSMVYSDKGLAPCLTLVPSSYYDMGAQLWELPEEDPDEDEEVVYVKMSKYGVDGCKYTTQKVMEKLKAIRDCGGPEVEVYGLRKVLYEKATANKNWISFNDWFKRESEKMKGCIEDKAQTYMVYQKLFKGNGFADRLKKLDPSHELKKAAAVENTKLECFANLCAFLNLDYSSKFAAIEKKYPLLEIVSDNAYYINDDKASDYVKMCDVALDKAENSVTV
jgi:hypothetical protein